MRLQVTRCKRLLNLTITSEDEEPRELSIRCPYELGHEGRCVFPELSQMRDRLVVVK